MLADCGPRTVTARAFWPGRAVGSLRIDWGGLFSVLSDCRGESVVLSRSAFKVFSDVGTPIRPVLKHGPRRLTYLRVNGRYETLRRN